MRAHVLTARTRRCSIVLFHCFTTLKLNNLLSHVLFYRNSFLFFARKTFENLCRDQIFRYQFIGRAHTMQKTERMNEIKKNVLVSMK